MRRPHQPIRSAFEESGAEVCPVDHEQRARMGMSACYYCWAPLAPTVCKHEYVCRFCGSAPTQPDALHTPASQEQEGEE